MPRFRYSLRTLFIVVTVVAAILAAYVVPQMRIVAKRKAVLVKLHEIGGGSWTLGNDGDILPPPPPLVRRWFGDESLYSIRFPNYILPSDAQEIKDAFPEATVVHPYVGK